MRLAFVVEYDGTDWKGWQSQSCKKTIQDEIQNALKFFTNQNLKVICAGRTDSGVHAKGQVIHFDTKIDRPIHNWVRGTNAFLPKSIRFRWGKKVSENFHARFSAKSRVYTYNIFNEGVESPLTSRFHTWIFKNLDEKRMQKASLHLIGKHDFTSFRSSQCQSSSPFRNLRRCDVFRSGNYLKIVFEADAFLHHMVRNIVGCLCEIGIGTKPVGWIKFVMDSKDRSLAAKTYPPQGLCLDCVKYEDNLL